MNKAVCLIVYMAIRPFAEVQLQKEIKEGTRVNGTGLKSYFPSTLSLSNQ